MKHAPPDAAVTGGIGRRMFVAGVLAGAVTVAGSGFVAAHTPYRQWAVYRKKHLIIGTCRADAGSYPFGKQLARLLARELPESRARVARAPDQQRLASLITTGQMALVLLRHREAWQLLTGAEPFEDYGPYRVQTVFEFPQHLLLGGAALPDYHAWIIAETLTRALGRTPLLGTGRPPVPVHPGTMALLEGRTLPPDAPVRDPAADEGHSH